MPGTFSGLEISSRALRADQTVIDTVGHNISNVNTAGYSRQTVELAATDPYTYPGLTHGTEPGQLGTGVEVTSITRARDEFVEQRLNTGVGDQSKYAVLRDMTQRVEDAYNEPGAGGLNSLITATFNAFQQLANTPETTATRDYVRSQAQTTAAGFRNVSSGLDKIVSDITDRITADVGQANSLAKQVAALNAQIVASTVSGDHANDLEDKRDALVRQLGSLVGATSTPVVDASGRPNGAVNVYVGGASIVQGKDAFALPTGYVSTGGVAYLTDGTNLTEIKTGEVAGLVQATDQISQYRADLNKVASTFINAVNTQHAAGYGLDGSTGQPFFTGTDAATIAVSPQIMASTDAIAAAAAPAPGQTVATGNGDNARAIADIANQQLFGLETINSYYSSRVAQIGTDAQGYDQQATNQDQVVAQLQNQRNSVSGVSLDEELTNMLQYQRSYQAAARMMTTFDDMVQTLISAVGTS